MTAPAKRRSGRMYPHFGTSTRTRAHSVAHGPLARRTTANPPPPTGRGVQIAGTEALTDLFRQLCLSPRRMDPIARARVRRCAW